MTKIGVFIIAMPKVVIGVGVLESKHEQQKIISLVKMAKNVANVSIPLNSCHAE